MSASKRPPPRQWAIDSNDPMIRRTPEEAAAYFKRRRAESGERSRKLFQRLAAEQERDRILKDKGRLDA